jgi:hypothetical protein
VEEEAHFDSIYCTLNRTYKKYHIAKRYKINKSIQKNMGLMNAIYNRVITFEGVVEKKVI